MVIGAFFFWGLEVPHEAVEGVDAAVPLDLAERGTAPPVAALVEQEPIDVFLPLGRSFLCASIRHSPRRSGAFVGETALFVDNCTIYGCT
jgi:hypothetical protein